jgi:hypothetical protein
MAKINIILLAMFFLALTVAVIADSDSGSNLGPGRPNGKVCVSDSECGSMYCDVLVGICQPSPTAPKVPPYCSPSCDIYQPCYTNGDCTSGNCDFSSSSCKEAKPQPTATLTVTYEGDDKTQKPVVGATVNITWKDTSGKEVSATAKTNDTGEVRIQLRDLEKFKENEAMLFPLIITLEDANFKLMDKQSNKLYEISTSFHAFNEAELNHKINLTRNDRIAVRIWDRLHEAYKFYRSSLGANVNYQMPEEVYLNSRGEGAFHSYDSATKAEDRGMTFGSVIFDKGATAHESPQNCEWHEFNHHAMMAIYSSMWDTKSIKNHLGWANPRSDDSYTEGFAEFMSLLETAYYSSQYPRLAAVPSAYYWDTTATNMEKNVKVKDDEEFAVAAILWDLYDPASNSSIDKDHIQIDRSVIWQVLSSKHEYSDGSIDYIKNSRDLYEAFKALNLKDFDKNYNDTYEPLNDSWMDNATALEKIFIAHGAYWDSNNNGIWDPGEEIGYTAARGDPTTRRTDKELPPGSYISANVNNGQVQNGTVKVKVVYPELYSYLNFEYESEFQNGLIGIEPPYDIPCTYMVSVKSETGAESATVNLTSQEYNTKYNPDNKYFSSASFTLPTTGEKEQTPTTGGTDQTSKGGSPICLGGFVIAGTGLWAFLLGRKKKDQ